MNQSEADRNQTEPDAEDLPMTADSDAVDASGDFRGPYGYGRPAHRPDPSGHYHFEPRAVRPLPANPKIRWR
ncbi:MAG: hypothetical protein ACTHJV_02025 [Rhizobiaceae bacterium]